MAPTRIVPAGLIRVGDAEIGYMFGQYKRITNRWEGVADRAKGMNMAALRCARKHRLRRGRIHGKYASSIEMTHRGQDCGPVSGSAMLPPMR